jgi:hypothetical protein
MDTSNMDKELRRDLKTLANFIRVYCHDRHADRATELVTLATHDVEAIHGRPLELCESCRRLLAHAFTKRTRCPMEPKPACKRCPDHCYHPTYRQQIREVMKYSGRKLVLRGRLDYLFHLLFD